MRTNTLRMWCAIASAAGLAATAVAQDRTGGRVKAVPASPVEVDNADVVPLSPGEIKALVEPIPEGTPVQRIRVYGDGRVERVAGGVSDAQGTTTLVYDNRLGRSVFGPTASVATARIADDIVTVGRAGCTLSRYVFRVTGDRRGDGSGAGLDYTVTFGLHRACPGAGAALIPGTAGQMTIPGAEAAMITEIEVIPTQSVTLPQSMYLAMTFSRDNCGTVVGAPASVGFSMDRLDFPGTACRAGLGGFPDGPHASFYAKVFTQQECEVWSPAYKASNNAGSRLNRGINVHIADDIRLSDFGLSECNLVGYEIAHKGNGIVDVSLHEQLSNSDPAAGFRLPGTRKFCFSSGANVQICRHELSEPVLIERQPLFIRFTNSTIDVGPVLGCRQPSLGDSADIFFQYSNSQSEWVDQVPAEGDACYRAFDVTLFCEGLPPLGACCDMVVLDSQGEAVCRDLVPKMNCPFSDVHVDGPGLWVRNARCGPVCVGGPNAGEECAQDDCLNGTCPATPICTAGANLDDPCTEDADCDSAPDAGDGVCEQVCIGGTRDGQPCAVDDCPSGSCLGSFCAGGDNDGDPCTREADCPNGTCENGPFGSGRACGLAACCKPDGASGFPCENLTRNECNAVLPIDGPRFFAPANLCGTGGFDCPNRACLAREGKCTLPRPAFCEGGFLDGEECDTGQPVNPCTGICVGGTNPGVECSTNSTCSGGGICERGICVGEVGCEDPFCCTEVCIADSFCCEQHWDLTCADRAFELCENPVPANDQCFSSRRGEGALLINVPDTIATNGISATATGDPGFCCKEGDEGGPGVGGVWYKFVAPDTSVRFSTCCTDARQVGDQIYRAEDGLVQVFEVPDQNRGKCTDGITPCDLSAPDPDAQCPEGDVCEFDEEVACQSLVPIACNDDAEDGCPCGQFENPGRSRVCASGLTPGDLYYVLVAGKTELDRGFYSLSVTSPCLADPPHPTDFCTEAAVPLGQDDPSNYPLVEPFDMSGETLEPATAAATFDCPGPDCSGGSTANSMVNDIWYDWTPPLSGQATVETCGGSDATTPDTGLVVYEGCDCPVEFVDELACNDFRGSPCFLGASVTFPVEGGQCYKIRLGGNFGDTPAGNLTIDASFDNQCREIEFIDPPAGVVDARQPGEPSGAGLPLGIRSLRIRGDSSATDLDCWEVCENPAPGGGDLPNAVDSVFPVGADEFIVNLSRALTPGAVTAITYNQDFGANPVVTQFIAHPGNANANGFADAADVDSLVNFLNGGPALPWGRYSTDMDHSGRTAPQDLLRLIDLLNGAAAFDPWLDTSLPECGECCPAP